MSELVRRIVRLERQLEALALPEISADLASPLLALPAQRGAWIGAVDSDGDWYDVSGHGHTLSDAGAPTLNYDGLVPYLYLDGAGDYFSWADTADNSITGTETQIAAAVRGLTIYCWAYPEETSTLEHLVAKWGAAGQRSYRLYLDASDQFVMEFSDDGTASDTVTSSAVSMNAWYLVVGRVRPSAFVDVYVGSSTGLELTSQATARASIHDGTADFEVGSRNGGNEEFQGRIACPSLCAAAHTTAIVSSTFNQMKGAFSV